MIFNNRRFLTRQKFEIKKSALKIERKNIFDAIEYEIAFDHINNKFKIQTIINNNLIFAGAFLFVFSFLFLPGSMPELTPILMCFSLIFIILPFIKRKKVVTIATGEGEVELYFNNKNKVEIVDYANKIIEAANNYLLNKYSKVDRSLPIEPQLENIQYLLHREIITEEIYESLKSRLLGNENKTSIGFGQN